MSKDEIRQKLIGLYPQLAAQKRITHGTNQVWRFTQELRVGDIVIVPHLGKAHFLRVTGRPLYLKHKLVDDTAIRRDICKLKTIAISDLPNAIRNGLKFRGHASVTLEHIKGAVFDFLGLDPEITAEEEEVARAEKLLKEALGSYVIQAKDEIIVTRKHAEVSEALVIFSHSRQENFSRTVWITFHWRGITSSVSVMSSPSFASLAEPQHGQFVGAAMTTRRAADARETACAMDACARRP